MRYAIVENGIVTNVIIKSLQTEIPNAIFCGDVPVAIGDTYENGCFYRNGNPVRSIYDEMAEALVLLGVME